MTRRDMAHRPHPLLEWLDAIVGFALILAFGYALLIYGAPA